MLPFCGKCQINIWVFSCTEREMTVFQKMQTISYNFMILTDITNSRISSERNGRLISLENKQRMQNKANGTAASKCCWNVSGGGISKLNINNLFPTIRFSYPNFAQLELLVYAFRILSSSQFPPSVSAMFPFPMAYFHFELRALVIRRHFMCSVLIRVQSRLIIWHPVITQFWATRKLGRTHNSAQRKRGS